MIYLASPYSSPDPLVVEERFEAACRAAARFMSEGHFIYSPIAHCHPIAQRGEMPTDFGYWRDYDRDMIGLASELWVLTLDGWRDSIGVAAEVVIARQRGIPVKEVAA